MRAYFFEVEVQDATRDFLTICREVAARHGPRRTIRIPGYSDELRLEADSFGAKNPTFYGDLVRIRMDNLPAKVSADGSVSDLELDDDEGIGEETAFFYVGAWNVLVVQSNRNGPSASALASYLSRQNRQGTEVWLTPMLNLAELEQLEELQRVTRVEASIAVPESQLGRVQPPSSLGGMLQAGRDLQAPKLTVTATVAYEWRKRELRKKGVFDLVRYLLGHQENEVSTLTVSGRNDHDESVMLDLLKAKLTYQADVDLLGRRASFDVRRRFLMDALREHRELLESRASKA